MNAKTKPSEFLHNAEAGWRTAADEIKALRAQAAALQDDLAALRRICDAERANCDALRGEFRRWRERATRAENDIRSLERQRNSMARLVAELEAYRYAVQADLNAEHLPAMGVDGPQPVTNAGKTARPPQQTAMFDASP